MVKIACVSETAVQGDITAGFTACVIPRSGGGASTGSSAPLDHRPLSRGSNETLKVTAWEKLADPYFSELQRGITAGR